MPQMLMDLGGVLGVPLVVSIATAVVTVHLSLRRYPSEKWWDRKADQYSAVIESLHVMKRETECTMEWMEKGTCHESEEDLGAQRRWREATKTVYSAIDTAGFLLCDDVDRELQKLKTALLAAECSNTVDGSVYQYGMLSDERDALSECLERLPRIARNDLAIKTPPWRRWSS